MSYEYKRVRIGHSETIAELALIGFRVVPGICPTVGGIVYLIMEREITT